MKKFFKDFKTFISKGNVLDLAVGVIIGGAFNKIVTSLVNDIIMPLITRMLGAASLADLSVPLKWEMITDPNTGDLIRNITLSWNYGSFIQTILDFLIIAFSVFLMIKLMMKSQDVFKEATEYVKKDKLSRADKKEIKAEGISLKDKEAVNAFRAEKARRLQEVKDAEVAAKKAAEEEAQKHTTEYLLEQILHTLQDKEDPKEALTQALEQTTNPKRKTKKV